MVLTHTWLYGFCGRILVSSQGLDVFCEILMLCSRWMIAGGVAPNQVSCNEFLDWINTNDLSCMALLDLVILGVMEGEGCIEFIEDWIGIYVIECV